MDVDAIVNAANRSLLGACSTVSILNGVDHLLASVGGGGGTQLYCVSSELRNLIRPRLPC